MNNPHHANPRSLKSRFTTRFLRALTKIRAQKPISSSSPTEIFRRYRKIKVAADKSMAYSVRRPVKTKFRQAVIKNMKTTTTTTGEDAVGFGVEASELRELVPGGEAMNLCSLLDETAHYIKCLTTQQQKYKTKEEDGRYLIMDIELNKWEIEEKMGLMFMNEEMGRNIFNRLTIMSMQGAYMVKQNKDECQAQRPSWPGLNQLSSF
ncbi:Detected protein of unknown function [Hibiscus syriacus]|uniref:IBH1-like N-terminal domain-containing protein n=1 Tax=Hibiscus syriacus TaxID=106335 RepID=A0A6A2Z434_HIBSY|nr:Detected protein of unknown function [Hibiscus syriacus]